MRIANNIYSPHAVVAMGVFAIFLIGLCFFPQGAWAKDVSAALLEKKISAMGEDTIAAAKEALDLLSQDDDDVTLADLNHARQTATRIDAMIDLERRLHELQKLRDERRGGSSSSRIHFTPKSSANTLPSVGRLPSLPVITPVAAPPPPVVVNNVSRSRGRPDILRISGAAGRYTALLKFANGDIRAVKVGDHLSDAETVRAITSSSVKIRGKKNYTLQIKNVDVVFSAVR